MACPEDPQAACPTNSKEIATGESRPFTTSVARIDIMSPTGHVWSATVEVLTPTALTKVEDIIPKQASAISDLEVGVTSTTGTYKRPSVPSVRSMVPEEHTSMTTTLKHLKSDQRPPSTHMRSGLSVAPTVQAIVVNRVPVVDPQLAPIIRDDAKMVMTCPENSQAACPTNSEVIASGEPRPSATCVAIVHNMFPSSHVWSAALQVLATAALAKIVSVLPEETMAISGFVVITPATCASDDPPVSSIRTMVPEEHASMTTSLKHLKSH
jgi:hypothetical protein